MALKKIATQVEKKAAGFSTAALEKIDDLINEFNAMSPFMEELGRNLASFDIEAGVLPQIKNFSSRFN